MKNMTVQKTGLIFGYTLIEVIVVVAIVGIIAAVGWPLYQEQSLKKGRTEAISDLGRIQVFMNRCYSDAGGYGCCDNATLDAYRAANPAPIPPARQYTLTLTFTNQDGTVDIPAPANCRDAQGFRVTAVPTAGTGQAGDTRCASFTINHLGGRTAVDNGAIPAPACWGD